MKTNNQNILAIRDVVREAFDRLGGADWLVTFAQASPENSRVFVSLVGRLIPTELVGKGGGPLQISIKMEGQPDVAGSLIEGQFIREPEPTKVLQ